MSRLKLVVATLGATAALLGTMSSAGNGPAEASQTGTEATLPGSAVPFASQARFTGEVAGSLQLTIEVWLKPAVEQAQLFAIAVSTPASPLFRHYMSPAAYAARFGASSAETARVESWLRTEAFTGVSTDSGRSYVRGTAPVAKINAAFHVRLDTYQASARRTTAPIPCTPTTGRSRCQPRSSAA